jgi:alkylated DNA repair dioxygenase AlkB
MYDHESIVPNADISMIRGYTENSLERLEYLKQNLQWLYDESSGRRFCNMGADYLIFGKVQRGQPFDPLILKIMQELNDQFSVAMNACYANYYENGKSTVPFRSNSGLQTDLDQPILSVAYGGTRLGVFRDSISEEEYEFLMYGGDLCIMGLNSQQKYLHGMRESSIYIEPRISLTFRKINSWASG